MKTAALRRLREKIRADQPTYGLWITLESPSITEMAVALNLDWVVIDAEHGHLDWKEILEHLRATVRSTTVAFVRIAELNGGLIKRALDIGADGILVPWIETAEQLQQALTFSLYPPQGLRGIGAERATAWGECLAAHTVEANENVLIIPIIETVKAGKNINELCAVPGIEMFFMGPSDYSSTAGYRGQWEGPGVAAKLLEIKDVIRSSGKACGVIGITSANLLERREQEFRLLGIGLDTGFLRQGIHAALEALGHDTEMHPALLQNTSPGKSDPLPYPPESFHPDRMESINDRGTGVATEPAAGVHMECLVGKHNGARNLTTGLVEFAPGAELPYHRHPVSESITLLSGTAVACIEGREYILSVFDNIVVPRGIAHSVRNLSNSEHARFHVAFASGSPEREWVSISFESQMMPDAAKGSPGKEHITRFRTAARSKAGPGTSFIDQFNHNLIPGIEMSGGYGLFQTGGRLPAHFHDFDESICIIGGTATCVVEGRRYLIEGGGNTALQPRGRVHYFVNEHEEPMEMLWVYAGPSPDRFVVDEQCVQPGNTVWRE